MESVAANVPALNHAQTRMRDAKLLPMMIPLSVVWLYTRAQAHTHTHTSCCICKTNDGICWLPSYLRQARTQQVGQATAETCICVTLGKSSRTCLTTAFDGASFALLHAEWARLALQRFAADTLEVALLCREPKDLADLAMAPGRCNDTPTYVQPLKPH